MARFGGSKRDGGTIPWRVNILDDSESAEEDADDVGEPHYYEGDTFVVPAHERQAKRPHPKYVVNMGWKPEMWPNSVLDGFIWHCATIPCRTQDW
jgi:hypothetical protein